MSTQVVTLPEASQLSPPRVSGWDSVELWVGSARATAGFFITTFGFECAGYAGPETGERDRVSYLLKQGDIRFVVTGALDRRSPITAHHRTHGDGVKHLSWKVGDVDETFAKAIARGATAVRNPWTERDADGEVRKAAFATYGETVHVLVDRSNYRGVFEPGYTTENLPSATAYRSTGVQRIDHVVGNVGDGQMERWASFYEDVMGFDRLVSFDETQIATEYSALRSIVVTDHDGIYMPINEPAPGRKKSQIQEYVETYDGAGVQHIALHTDDIASTVGALRDRGLRFMRVPDTYYVAARERMDGIDLPWDELQRHNILVDRDGSGYLLQIFSEVVTDRPALFIEIIERHGAKGFGEGNFKALFEAFERDQERRGNL
jgi:4-hydroxyphenylpyruvate dioxygenase